MMITPLSWPLGIVENEYSDNDILPRVVQGKLKNLKLSTRVILRLRKMAKKKQKNITKT